MTDTDRLEVELSDPAQALVEAMAALDGDILVLGVSGKMGPSLARMALRASQQAGIQRTVWGVARFGNAGTETRLSAWGVETIRTDLLDPAALAALPEARNVVLMAGQKFGTMEDPEATWATNVVLPQRVAWRYRNSRIVVFSTGNVYPLTAVDSLGPSEDHPMDPVGEYARSAAERERVLGRLAVDQQTPIAIMRLNYAVEPRYGVIRDLADRVLRQQPIDLTMGYVNLIWQRDANAIALRLLAHCAVPPLTLNVTGPNVISVRSIAESLGRLFGTNPVFEGREAETALLSDAGRCRVLMGELPVSHEEMIDRVGRWVLADGESLGKPTGFQERDGRF